ncbi:MAG: DUF3883 domain-containing protein [Patescibacteria group bacterium]
MYQTPPEHFLRLHFPRSRFSRRFEDTLLLLANKIIEMGMMDKESFDTLLDKTIAETTSEPLTEKTIHNQRTEMIRLFGLAKYVENLAVPGNRLALLTQTQDIPRFFKSFCNRFQFPGGFVKPDRVSEMVKAGVKLKPAPYILRLLIIGNQKHGDFAISAAEVTHFLFNDTRITVQKEEPNIPLARIKEARENGIELDRTSDIIRYARDFLNYMVEANLLTEFKGMYALNNKEKQAIQSIITNKDFFDKYSEVIKPDGSWDTEEYKKVDTEWMEWFADSVEDKVFETKTTALVQDDSNFPNQWKKIKEMLERKDAGLRGAALKEIGDEGEQIVLEYEREEISKTRPDLVRMVKLVSATAALGYDVISMYTEDGRRKKYIEVKTTKKNYETGFLIPFTISINEWSVAQQLAEDYYIYRVIITKEGISIFTIQNPPQRNKEGNLVVEPIGYKIVYTEKSGTLLKL